MMQLLGMCTQSTVDFAVSTKTVHDVLPGCHDVNAPKRSRHFTDRGDNERLNGNQGVSARRK